MRTAVWASTVPYLVVQAVVFAVYCWLLWDFADSIGVLFLAGLGSLGSVTFFWGLGEALAGALGRTLKDASERRRPLEHGKLAVVEGTIEPNGPGLKAPFSGRDCVAYAYETEPVDSEGMGPSPSIMGWALAPSVVRSQQGDVRIVGATSTSLTEWKVEEDVDRAAWRARAAEFVERTKFVTGLEGLRSAQSGRESRVDVMRFRSERGFEACRLQERVVRAGEAVTAVGIWDASIGSLVLRTSWRTATTGRLLPGDAATALAEEQRRKWRGLAMWTVWVAIAHAMIALLVARDAILR